MWQSDRTVRGKRAKHWHTAMHARDPAKGCSLKSMQERQEQACDIEATVMPIGAEKLDDEHMTWYVVSRARPKDAQVGSAQVSTDRLLHTISAGSIHNQANHMHFSHVARRTIECGTSSRIRGVAQNAPHHLWLPTPFKKPYFPFQVYPRLAKAEIDSCRRSPRLAALEGCGSWEDRSILAGDGNCSEATLSKGPRCDEALPMSGGWLDPSTTYAKGILTARSGTEDAWF